MQICGSACTAINVTQYINRIKCRNHTIMSIDNRISNLDAKIPKKLEIEGTTLIAIMLSMNKPISNITLTREKTERILSKVKNYTCVSTVCTLNQYNAKSLT